MKWVDALGEPIIPSAYGWRNKQPDAERIIIKPCVKGSVGCIDCGAPECGELAFEV